VLHLDRNGYYGGECASLNLTNLYKKFVKNEEPPKAFFDALGSNRDYNVDLIPKFILAGGARVPRPATLLARCRVRDAAPPPPPAGLLVKMLVYTDVTRYLDFKLIDGSYVFKKGGGIHKVPATEKEAISTGLVGLLQKNWLRGFLKYMAKYKQSDPKTWDGTDLTKVTMKQFYDKMWLDAETQVRGWHEGGRTRPATPSLTLAARSRPCRTLWATPWRCTATTRT